MKTWFVDFSGYCEIEAETAREAEEIFWKNLPSVGENDVWDIDCIEEKIGDFERIVLNEDFERTELLDEIDCE